MLRPLMLTCALYCLAASAGAAEPVNGSVPPVQGREVVPLADLPALGEWKGRSYAYAGQALYVRAGNGDWHSVLFRGGKWQIADDTGRYGDWKMTEPITVTDETFRAEVLESGSLVVLDVWASWCMPCRQVQHAFCDLAEANGDIKVVKMNFDECPKTVQAYGITSLPTVILFHGGQVRMRYEGQKPHDFIAESVTLTKSLLPQPPETAPRVAATR